MISPQISASRSSEPLLDGGSDNDLGSGSTQNRNNTVAEEEEGRGGRSWRTIGAHERRRHELRSRSPGEISRFQNKRKITLAALALGISLVTFVVQTETAVHIQHVLGWKKAYCMLYMTHGSWVVLWPLQILFLRIRSRKLGWKYFLRSHLSSVRTTAQMVQYGTTRISTAQAAVDPLPFAVKQIAIIASSLTVAGSSWYVAVNMTTPSDLTAIYNCSAFFAYAFSIPLLHEKIRLGKIGSVAIAILGVMVVAYGDGSSSNDESEAAQNRVLGNLIIGVGSVLYGFYEVLYKKLACPPENTSPGRGVIYANVVATGIGLFTLTVLWIPLPILHFTGLETFEIPNREVMWYLFISVFSNVAFSGAFLALISLTSPVLSSVAALLTIFLVAITDWLLTGVPLTPAAMFGGLLIIGAFGLLSWDSWKELGEEQAKRLKKEDEVDSEVLDEDGSDGAEEEEDGRLLEEGRS
ncbi:putative DUF6 domain protein [Peziza echinospora]|nr:putative DUF6 domain protein [Peziza echinospora]